MMMMMMVIMMMRTIMMTIMIKFYYRSLQVVTKNISDYLFRLNTPSIDLPRLIRSGQCGNESPVAVACSLLEIF